METTRGKLFIISDSNFMKEVTGAEYRLYIALKTISKYNENGVNYLNDYQCEFSKLSRELKLENGLNKSGEIGYMTRKTISKLFKSLESKGIIEREDTGENRYIYKITKEKPYKFTIINKETLEILSKKFKGQLLKTYIYLSGIYSCASRQPIKMNRETIAKAINELSNDGTIKERQLENVTKYVKTLKDLKLLDYKIISIKRKTYTTAYEIKDITDKIEAN
ncbi:hypothetical protein P7A62_00610 [Clostridium perfringens]|nr:hypothetical protein [Clostridium perfringens]